MTLSFEASDRLLAGADRWAEARMIDSEEALEVKAEQALLEVENLVANAFEVEFEVEGRTITHHPSEELRTLLEEQAAEVGVDPATLLRMHVDLFADAFVGEDDRPPNAAPRDG